jgi:hypothetical protein
MLRVLETRLAIEKARNQVIAELTAAEAQNNEGAPAPAANDEEDTLNKNDLEEPEGNDAQAGSAGAETRMEVDESKVKTEEDGDKMES